MSLKTIFLSLFVLTTTLQATELKLSHQDKLVTFWTNYYTKKKKSLFINHLKNADRYQEVVSKILESHKLPADLFYVALIESGFNSKIRSRAGAVGPWQFMPATARRYGLRVDASVDERTNIYKATHAAAGYFKDLFNIFGSWELALCAYNAGEYKIIRAIRKGNERHYIKLVKKGLLPKETVYYIPKVVAAKEIAQNRLKFGMRENYSSTSDKKFYDRAKKKIVYGSFRLKDLAKKWNVSYYDLKRLNPDIRHQRVRVKRSMELYIPGASINKVAKQDLKDVIFPKEYVVKKGDTLIGVGYKFGLTLKELVEANSLVKYRIYPGQKLILKKTSPEKIYVVRRGDNLHQIARRFGTTVRKIREKNALRGSRIFPRQRIRIPKSI